MPGWGWLEGTNFDHQNATSPEMTPHEFVVICMYINHLGKQTSVPCLSVPLGNCPFALARACSSCSLAGAVNAGKPSTLGDEVGLSKEAVWGLPKWEGPVGLGVLTPFA